MARKKIVFVIVEGPSDDDALEVLLEKLFDNSTVFVHITHGDITSDPEVDPAQIRSVVGNIVKAYAKSNHFTKVHFQEIIHIVDMDGAYIPDHCITEEATARKPVYTLTELKTDSVHGLRLRNERKRRCLDLLSTARESWSIPYQAYYMSCNLDHVLYNKQNSTDEEKETDALAFARRFKNDLEGFVRFISDSDFSVTSGYVDSWNYIKQERHSLERHTNLGICLKPALAAKAERDSQMVNKES